MRNALDGVQRGEVGQRTAAASSAKKDELALRSCCLNVLKFNFNCAVGHKHGITANTSVDLKGWKLCLVDMVQLVLHYFMEPRGWPELVPAACLNCPAEFTSSCFILRK